MKRSRAFVPTSFVLIMLFVVIAHRVCAQTENEITNSEKKAHSLESYIHSMVNKDQKRPPFERWDETRDFPVFPDKYDFDNQTRVFNAFSELQKQRGEALWPLLLKHATDKEYACTIEQTNAKSSDIIDVRNYTVGQLCQELIYLDLQNVYRNVLPLRDNPVHLHPELYHFYWNDRYPSLSLNGFFDEGLKEWSEKHAHKPMYEVQIAVCEWAIKNASGLKDVSEEKKKKFVTDLNSQINTLKDARQPIVEKPKHDYVKMKAIGHGRAEYYRSRLKRKLHK